MGRNQVDEVKPDRFRTWQNGIPRRKILRFLKLVPEAVDDFYADRDMAHEFSSHIIRHDETLFGVAIFPEFARIVVQNSSKKQVVIESLINGRQSFSSSHHLRDVLHEAAASCVVIVPGRRSSSHPIS